MKISDDHDILRLYLLTVALLVELWLQDLLLYFGQETLNFACLHQWQVPIVAIRQFQGRNLELFHKVHGQFLQWEVTVIQLTLRGRTAATSTHHSGSLGLFRMENCAVLKTCSAIAMQVLGTLPDFAVLKCPIPCRFCFQAIALATALRTATVHGAESALLLCQCLVVTDGSDEVHFKQEEHQRPQHFHQGNLSVIAQKTDLICLGVVWAEIGGSAKIKMRSMLCFAFAWMFAFSLHDFLTKPFQNTWWISLRNASQRATSSHLCFFSFSQSSQLFQGLRPRVSPGLGGSHGVHSRLFLKCRCDTPFRLEWWWNGGIQGPSRMTGVITCALFFSGQSNPMIRCRQIISQTSLFPNVSERHCIRLLYRSLEVQYIRPYQIISWSYKSFKPRWSNFLAS